MGMDVYGRNPKNESGEYFRESVWGWRPLWGYIERVAPELAAKVPGAHFNDGDGLGDRDAKLLADILEAKVRNGDHVKAEQAFKAELDAMPDEPCELCEGTGKRLDPPMKGAGNYPCNGCSQTGKRRPFETHYTLRAESIDQFATFARYSGGFKIC